MGKSNKASQQKQNKVNVNGRVLEVLPDTKYRIEIEIGDFKHEIIGYPSGKIRKNYIKLAEDDEVIVEMSPEYDLNKGRVVWKKNKYRPGSPDWATADSFDDPEVSDDEVEDKDVKKAAPNKSKSKVIKKK